MKGRIITVGKVKKRWIREGIQEYHKRIPELEIVAIKDSTPDKEFEKITSLLRGNEYVVALSERGESMPSVDFSQFIQAHASEPFAFIIGGPDGLSDRFFSLAHRTLCLSAMTLTHEMAQLFLVEQLYRAKSIWQNTGYHK